MKSKAMLKYCAVAGAVGCGWFVVILVPGITREWLLADILQNLGCLVVASIIVALAARTFIGKRRHRWRAPVTSHGNSISRLSRIPELVRRITLVTNISIRRL